MIVSPFLTSSSMLVRFTLSLLIDMDCMARIVFLKIHYIISFWNISIRFSHFHFSPLIHANFANSIFRMPVSQGLNPLPTVAPFQGFFGLAPSFLSNHRYRSGYSRGYHPGLTDHGLSGL